MQNYSCEMMKGKLLYFDTEVGGNLEIDFCIMPLLLSFSGYQVTLFVKFSRFGSGCFPDSLSSHKQNLDT